jgi:phosphoglycolate phosphatase
LLAPSLPRSRVAARQPSEFTDKDAWMATLFFDLDGTLIDSAVGITRCVTYALERLDQPVPPPEELRRWIGPALRVSFAPLLQDTDRIEQAVLYYRERFQTHGWQEHEIYPGIGEVVVAAHGAGHRLAVVTAKHEPDARRIIEDLPFGHLFEDIIGSTTDGRLSHKPELVGEALARLGISNENVWMIGDRHMDIDGAREHGLTSVGVLWGFGNEEELRTAGATHIARSPPDLGRLLGHC